MVLNTEYPLNSAAVDDDKKAPGGNTSSIADKKTDEEKESPGAVVAPSVVTGRRVMDDKRPKTSFENKMTRSGRNLPALRRISTTPLGHNHPLNNKNSTSSSVETLASTPPPLKEPPSASRKNPLRSAAATARRLVGSKTNEVQPGIFFFSSLFLVILPVVVALFFRYLSFDCARPFLCPSLIKRRACHGRRLRRHLLSRPSSCVDLFISLCRNQHAGILLLALQRFTRSLSHALGVGLK